MTNAVNTVLSIKPITRTAVSVFNACGDGVITTTTTQGGGRVTARIIVGGRISGFLGAWEAITSRPQILNIVKEGYKLPFTSRPPTTSQPPFQRVVGEARETWIQVIKDMVAMEAIEEVVDPTSRGTYSHMFLRPKPNGKKRPIINLKQLNGRLNVLPFRMATPQSVLKSLSKNDWTTSIDLKDAYFHVPIHGPHRKYLRFAILERVYQFKTLPFGLAPAPQVFSSLVKVLVTWGRARGINIIAYLDDWLIHGPDKAILEQQTQTLANAARALGWVLNTEKSDLQPKQVFDFLGMRINTTTGTVAPVERRIRDMVDCALTLKSGVTIPARRLLKLQGLMVSLGDIILLGKLHRRPFQEALKPLRIHADINGQVLVPQALVETVRWWTKEANLRKEVGFLTNTQVVTIVTDASTVGWGATVQDEPIRGLWTQEETKLHINCLEMLGVKRALEHTQVSLDGKHLALHTDNTTVKAYLLKQGGTVSRNLNSLTAEVWAEICRLNATLSVAHISGTLNVLADRLSRPGQVLQGEWELNQEVFERLTGVWGTPDIDLFATRFNRKITRFISPCPDADAAEQDAMGADWTKYRLPYAFPPFNLILPVLERIRDQSMQCLIVTPAWTGNPFFPLLASLSVRDPVYLGHETDLLVQGFAPLIKQYQDPARLALHAWFVSSETLQTGGSPRKWPEYQLDPSANPHWASTQKYGNGSPLGYSPSGEVIRSMPLPRR